jgi:hypothetical protein
MSSRTAIAAPAASAAPGAADRAARRRAVNEFSATRVILPRAVSLNDLVLMAPCRCRAPVSIRAKLVIRASSAQNAYKPHTNIGHAANRLTMYQVRPCTRSSTALAIKAGWRGPGLANSGASRFRSPAGRQGRDCSSNKGVGSPGGCQRCEFHGRPARGQKRE